MRHTVRQFKEIVDINGSLFNRLRKNRYLPYALLTTVFLAAACIHIWQRVHVLKLVTEVSELTKENIKLDDALKKVNSEVARLSMATRVEKYAIDTLGMIHVPADRFYTLIPGDKMMHDKGDLEAMSEAVRRIVEYLPVTSENTAMAGEPSQIRNDSPISAGSDQ